MCAHPHYPRPTQLSNPGYATVMNLLCVRDRANLCCSFNQERTKTDCYCVHVYTLSLTLITLFFFCFFCFFVFVFLHISKYRQSSRLLFTDNQVLGLADLRAHFLGPTAPLVVATASPCLQPLDYLPARVWH